MYLKNYFFFILITLSILIIPSISEYLSIKQFSAIALIVDNYIKLIYLFFFINIFIFYLEFGSKFNLIQKYFNNNLLNKLLVIFISNLLFLLPIISARYGYEWTSYANSPQGLNSCCNFAGVFPMADAKMYYEGALKMIFDDKIGSHTLRKPLHSAILAFELILTNFNFLKVLSLQATLISTFLVLVCFELSHFFKKSFIFAFWIVFYLTMQDFTPTTMTATSGVWVNLIALLFIILSIKSRSYCYCAISLGVYILGFTIKPGPILVAFAILILGLYLSKNYKDKIKFICLSLVCIFIALQPTKLLIDKYNPNPESGAFGGNGIGILYMYSVGSSDWRQLFNDFPNERKSLGEGEYYKSFAFNKVKENIKDNPIVFINSIKDATLNSYFILPSSFFAHFFKNLIDSELTTKHKYLIFLFFNLSIFLFVINKKTNFKIKIFALLFIYSYFFSQSALDISGGSLRFQLNTAYIPLFIFIFGLFQFKNIYTNHEATSQENYKINYLYLVFIIIFIFFSINVKIINSFINPDLSLLKNEIKKLPHKNNNDEKYFYFLFGDQMQTLRIVNNKQRQIRPYIGIEEFTNSPYIIVGERMSYFKNYKTNKLLFYGLELKQMRVARYWYKDNSLCIPSYPTIFRAEISDDSLKPHVYIVKNLTPIDINGNKILIENCSKLS